VFTSRATGYPYAMTKAQEQEQLRGDEAGLVNSARAQLKSFIDKLDVLAREGQDMLVDMDARLRDFDVNVSRRYEPTTEKKQG
jgi:BMFP domain-containing protein YqiC